MKKLKNILLWIVLIAYMVFALGFSAERREKIICNKIDIRIDDDDAMNHFINKLDIEKILEPYRYRIIGKHIDSVNTLLTETIIAKSPTIRKTAVYMTIDGKLNIDVEQRTPIVRVINKRLQNYYIDNTGQIVPIYHRCSAYSLIVNGFINEPFDITVGRNIFPSKKDSILRPNIIYDIYKIALYIKNNDFWQSQIQQMYVNEKQDIILIPRVGQQTIIFGKSDDIEIKFKKLKSMYRTFNVIGWTKYKTINLKFKDQVICTKL